MGYIILNLLLKQLVSGTILPGSHITFYGKVLTTASSVALARKEHDIRIMIFF
jgi:hypothetical protein